MENISLISFKNFFELQKYNELKKEYMDYLESEKIKICALTLKKIRQEKKLSQKEFGEKIEKKQNTILKYELGLSKINSKVWSNIVKIFDIKYTDFYNIIKNSKSERQFLKNDTDFILNEKINDTLLKDLTFDTQENIDDIKETINEDLSDLFFELESDEINIFIENLLKKIYPFYIEKISDNESNQNISQNITLIEKIKTQTENIKDVEKKELLKKKLKKIEKDIENYTIFLLKQNGFIE